MSRSAVNRLLVYSRPGCHLCEVLLEALLPIARDRIEIQVLDIDARPEWLAEYGTRIPVVELNGDTLCEYTLDATAVNAAIDRAIGS